jgi:hypothetical protein
MPAMRPQVSTKGGDVIVPAVFLLLVPQEPVASTACFKFQVQKTNEPEEWREAGLKYLAGDYFQRPELFSDEMTAVFAADSRVAASLLRAKEVGLHFAQYSQSFHILCSVRSLRKNEPARESSLWQARLFNSDVPADANVLTFRPNWNKATAHPMPQTPSTARNGR